MSEPSTLSRPRPAAVRGLWRLGVVVTVASAVALVYARLAWVAHPNGYSDGIEPPDLIAADLLSAIGSSALTAGVVCIGLALAATAILHGRSAAEPVDSLEPDALDERTVAAFAFQPAPDPAPVARPLDPEAFRRPRPDKHPSL